MSCFSLSHCNRYERSLERKGVVRSHEHPPGSATTKSRNLRGGAQHVITLIGPCSSPPYSGCS